MNAFGDLRNCAIVELDFGGKSLNQDSVRDLPLCRDAEALGDRCFQGSKGYWDFSLGIAVVGDVERHEPLPFDGGFGGEDSGNREIGQATIMVDPGVEEPMKVYAAIFWSSFSKYSGEASTAEE